MLYIGYFIIVDGKNIKKESCFGISIIELPSLENRISRLCASPFGSPPRPPSTPKKHALHKIFDRFELANYQKISFGKFHF